jgi:nitrate/nitrite-specific signal transduction histidine kinase
LKHPRPRIAQVLTAIQKSGSGPDWVSLRVADNGRGITEERVGGRGLINMRNRAARISAFLKLDTVPGAGTVVGLRFRVEPSKEDGDATSRVPPGGLNTEAVIERVRRQ